MIKCSRPSSRGTAFARLALWSALLAAGMLSNGASQGHANPGSESWVLYLRAVLPVDDPAADHHAVELASKGVRTVALHWDGGQPESLQRELRAMRRQGLKLTGVSGDLDAWQDVLEEVSSEVRLLVHLEDRRPGLHDQKIRAAGRPLLGLLKQAADAGRAVSLYQSGTGWAARGETLRDMQAWLDRFRPGQEIGLILRFPAKGAEVQPDDTGAATGFSIPLGALAGRTPTGVVSRIEATAGNRDRTLWIDATAVPAEAVADRLANVFGGALTAGKPDP